MAKKKAAAAATAETSLNELGVPELQARLREVREGHFRLRFRHATTPLKNPMELRHARREIARLQTVLNQKNRGAA